MSFLYLLEKIRTPLLDELMLLVTRLGEETVFLVIALIVFWCIDKRRGYFVLAVGFLGTMVNQFLKLLCRVPRPWVLDPNFTIVEQAREAATGYSFPSGHTQTAVGTFGALAATTEKKWLRWSFVILAALVALSRMYLGVHTPYDVLAGAACAIALVILLKPAVLGKDPKSINLLLGAMIVLGIVFVLFVELFPFPADMDVHNLESGYQNAYTLLGSIIGVAVVYIVDEKYLHFEVKATMSGQILKVVLGLLAVLAVKEGLRAPLDTLFGGHIAARAIRYFLIVIMAGIIWPLTFRFFAEFGKREKKGELRND